MGRGGRLLLRRAPRHGRRIAAARVPLDRRAAPARCATTLGRTTLARLPDFATASTGSSEQPPESPSVVAHMHVSGGTPAGGCCRSSGPDRLRRILARDARRGRVPLARTACARSRRVHREHPLDARCSAASSRRVDYEPGESTTGLVRRQLELARAGLVPGQLPARSRRCAATTATSATTSPSSSRPARATSMSLDEVADELSDRLIAIFLLDEDGRRPVLRRLPRCSRPTRPGTTT